MQIALQLFIDQHGDANEFLEYASIENAEILLDQIEPDLPPDASGFAKKSSNAGKPRARLNRHSAWPRETPWSAPIPSLSAQPRLLCAYCGQSL